MLSIPMICMIVGFVPNGERGDCSPSGVGGVGGVVYSNNYWCIIPQTPRTPETLQALLSPKCFTDTATNTKDTRGTAGTTITKAPHGYSYIDTKDTRGTVGTAGLWPPKHLTGTVTPRTLQALLSPKHLTDTTTDTKDTRGTAGTTVTKASHRYRHRHQGHRRYCRHYCHQNTSQIQLQTPRILEALWALLPPSHLTDTATNTKDTWALQALLSPKNLTDTAKDTMDTRGTVGTIYCHQSTSQTQQQTPRTPEALPALLSPKHVLDAATDIKDTRGTQL